MSQGSRGGASRPHPADDLIRELIDSPRPTTSRDLSVIRQRMASATFRQRRKRLSRHYLEIARAEGVEINRDTDTLTAHRIKHVLKQQQWTTTTTPLEYLEDAHKAALSNAGSVAVYRNQVADHVSSVIVPTSLVVPTDRLGRRAGAFIFVVYSADSATLITAFMIRDRQSATIPAGAVWLS